MKNAIPTAPLFLPAAFCQIANGQILGSEHHRGVTWGKLSLLPLSRLWIYGRAQHLPWFSRRLHRFASVEKDSTFSTDAKRRQRHRALWKRIFQRFSLYFLENRLIFKFLSVKCRLNLQIILLLSPFSLLKLYLKVSYKSILHPTVPVKNPEKSNIFQPLYSAQRPSPASILPSLTLPWDKLPRQKNCENYPPTFLYPLHNAIILFWGHSTSGPCFSPLPSGQSDFATA